MTLRYEEKKDERPGQSQDRTTRRREEDTKTHEDLEPFRRIVFRDDGSEGYGMADPLAETTLLAERNDGVGTDV